MKFNDHLFFADHFTAKLSVRMKVGPDFVATNFTFYDCSSYSSCTQCVSSAFPCDWCVGGHRCTHDTGENCRNDILVTGVSSVGPSIRSGPGFCPRINATAGGTTEGKDYYLDVYQKENIKTFNDILIAFLFLKC
jgi:plexin A